MNLFTTHKTNTRKTKWPHPAGEPFDLGLFIRESNLIDPQYEAGEVIPGARPGDPMYDRHKAAFECAVDLFRSERIPKDFDCKIHRELTRGINFFEESGASGFRRRVPARINGKYVEKPYLLESMIEERLHPLIVRGRTLRDEAAKAAGWWIHDAFECVHPFLDGNGRSGRCILNAFFIATDTPPIVIRLTDQIFYYEQIQRFRETRYDAFRSGEALGFPGGEE